MSHGSETITLRAGASYGHTGMYIARILGRDSKFTFSREFVGRKIDSRNSEAMLDEAGLYEVMDIDRKGRKVHCYVIIARHPSGEGLEKLSCDKEDAMKIAKLLADRSIDEIIENRDDGWDILTASETARKQAGQTVDSAIAACWAAMEALPEKQAKAVLKALRDRVSPPKAKPEPQAAEQPAADAETPAAE